MYRFIFLVLFMCVTNIAKAQIKYSKKIEGQSLLFLSHTVSVDSGENWKRYYLERENGWSLSVSNGI